MTVINRLENDAIDIDDGDADDIDTDVDAPTPLFDEEHLQSRLEIIRQYVAQPIPQQPWDDDVPALIPFHDHVGDGDHDVGDGTNNHAGSTGTSSTSGGGGIIIGSARHAANIPLLKSLNVTAVLNCASGGIPRLPVDELEENGIRYAFTNCRQDSYTYPILHNKEQVVVRPDKLENSITGKKTTFEERIVPSQHLEVSNSLFLELLRENKRGNVLFFCLAGQNRSAALAAATLMLHGMSLEHVLKYCAQQRPFVLENLGFQRQLVELEAIIDKLLNGTLVSRHEIRHRFKSHWELIQHTRSPSFLSTINQVSKRVRKGSSATTVEIELLIPGLCTMEVNIPIESTIPNVKKCLVQHVNNNLLRHDECPSQIAKAWLVLAMFGSDDMYDLPLEVEAVELKVQLERMRLMFGLHTRLVDGEPYITWTERCRFALVIFSVIKHPKDSTSNIDAMDDSMDPSMRTDQVPWTFVHEERPNAPATLLENTLRSTHLRAWDFVTGESLASNLPIVFSFAEDPRDRRAFMMVSQSAGTLQQFHCPGEGDILGMGENAIVHRVQLSFTQADGSHRDEHWTRVNVGLSNERPASTSSIIKHEGEEQFWDAAVKRPFSLGKMLVFLQNSSEAGLAKRLRLANLLNSDKRVLYFYGLGLGLSTNAYNQNEYKFELMLLAKYEEDFSTYTMRCFMEEYLTIPSSVTNEERKASIVRMQSQFSITAVKVLLVSLLNAFRDLTLMGIQAFDFNHLNNVLVSRDYQSVRLIDIDGNAQGSVHYPTLTNGNLSPRQPVYPPQKPCLNVDLNILLPSVIEQLILGKGRGKSFVSNTRSAIWRAKEMDAKAMIQTILMENFYPGIENEETDGEMKMKVETHVKKVGEWFYAVLKKKSPWTNWTNDIYDVMRCIDHLPIS